MELDKNKWNAALRLILNDLNKPDEELRKKAHDNSFFYEYLWIKDQLTEHAHTLWR